MIEISLCMIVKNEEKILTRCLDSVADLVDEIVIVDTGSTDATKKIAANYTDKIYDFTWVDDFSAARNFAFSVSVILQLSGNTFTKDFGCQNGCITCMRWSCIFPGMMKIFWKRKNFLRRL